MLNRLTYALLLIALAGCGDSDAPRDGGPAITDGGMDAGSVEDASPDSLTGLDGSVDARPPAVCPEGIPLGDFAGKPVVEVVIGDLGPYSVVVDTGAPRSVLDIGVANEVGMGPYTIHVADQEVILDSIERIDLAAVGLPGIDGVLGTDVFGTFAVTFDRARERFWVQTESDERSLLACEHVNGAPERLEYRLQRYIFVPGNIENVDGWFLVDTGASLGATPNAIFDGLHATRPRAFVDGFYTPAAIGTFYARLSTVGHMEVAGLRVDSVSTRTIPATLIPVPRFEDDAPFLGILPTGFLRHFLMTVDYPAGVLRLAPYEGGERADHNRWFTYGIGLQRLNEVATVGQVLPGSSALESGVQVGDIVVSVNGEMMAPLQPGSRSWRLMSRGETISTIVLERGGEPVTVILEARDLLTLPAE